MSMALTRGLVVVLLLLGATLPLLLLLSHKAGNFISETRCRGEVESSLTT
jgi:hypothetical protein